MDQVQEGLCHDVRCDHSHLPGSSCDPPAEGFPKLNKMMFAYSFGFAGGGGGGLSSSSSRKAGLKCKLCQSRLICPLLVECLHHVVAYGCSLRHAGPCEIAGTAKP